MWMSWVGWVRLKLLAAQMQAVIKPTHKVCLSKSCVRRLLSSVWAKRHQPRSGGKHHLTPLVTWFIWMKSLTRDSTADERVTDCRPVLSYYAVLFDLWLRYCMWVGFGCFGGFFCMLKYFNENNMLHKQIFKSKLVTFLPNPINTRHACKPS